ncbi:MAG: phosphonoacetaldehyde reductase [Firmicutes bacterium]|nr:phosphonoacetaldehyde reductase [Candidatus Fermentithermobacillaceae bacterium]
MSRLYIPGEVYLLTADEFYDDSLAWLKGKRVLLVMNSSHEERIGLKGWVDALRKTALTYSRLEGIASNPTVDDLLRNLHRVPQEAPDVIVAVGGGSSIDMAKALAALWYMKSQELSRSQVLSCIASKQYLAGETRIPICAVPTTAGTGSEVTKWATIWDTQGRAKLSVETPWLTPVRAYIVPEFTATMPPRLILATGLDALCHSVEAYWAKASSPMVRELSKPAIRLIVEYLPGVLAEDSRGYANREKMCLGSLFSGLAFSHTRTTACHSISYPLTMTYGIEHGLACALTLAGVLEINAPAIEDPDGLYGALGVRNPGELQAWLDSVCDGIVKLRLRWFGVEERDIPALTEGSFTLGRMDNNPIPLGQGDVSALLRRILE